MQRRGLRCLTAVVVLCIWAMSSAELESEVVGLGELDPMAVKSPPFAAHDELEEAEAGGARRLLAKDQDWSTVGSAAFRAVTSRAGGVLNVGGNSKWFFNRLMGRLETASGKCLERAGAATKLSACSAAKTQYWTHECQAFTNRGGASKALLVLDNKAKMVKYTAEKTQLWHYKEKVPHAACANKMKKVLKFDGSLESAVVSKKFLSAPTLEYTLLLWVNPTSGAPFSYASSKTTAIAVWIKGGKLTVYAMNTPISTTVSVPASKWTHLAVTWKSSTGVMQVYKNGAAAFKKTGVAKGKKITPGGCVMLGHAAQKGCASMMPGSGYKGEVINVMLYRGVKCAALIKANMFSPISRTVLAGINKVSGKRPEDNLRLAYMTRQYAKEEIGEKFPPKCSLTKPIPQKKVSGPGGWMKWGGGGDVHYNSFAHCKYDDQSVGDWTAVKVNKLYWKDYPLMVQFRTSPQRTNCPWCKKQSNGQSSVSFIDGCAIRYKDEQASAGFGGFNFPKSNYKPYAAFNGAKMPGAWAGKSFRTKGFVRGKHMRAKCSMSYGRGYGSGSGNLNVKLNDGSELYCAKGSIRLTIPKKLVGKIGGIAGTGVKSKDFVVGPNKARMANKGLKPGSKMPGLGGCPPRYQYPIRGSPYNGNAENKPVVQWFYSWMVDGASIPEAFGYLGNKNSNFFNTADRSKAVAGGNANRPGGAKAKAVHKCRALKANKKAHQKCIFDFLVLGGAGVKITVKDARQKKRLKGSKATAQSVRDCSKWRNDGYWTGHPSWGCASTFEKQSVAGQMAEASKFAAKAKAMAKKEHGTKQKAIKAAAKKQAAMRAAAEKKAEGSRKTARKETAAKKKERQAREKKAKIKERGLKAARRKAEHAKKKEFHAKDVAKAKKAAERCAKDKDKEKKRAAEGAKKSEGRSKENLKKAKADAARKNSNEKARKAKKAKWKAEERNKKKARDQEKTKKANAKVAEKKKKEKMWKDVAKKDELKVKKDNRKRERARKKSEKAKKKLRAERGKKERAKKKEVYTKEFKRKAEKYKKETFRKRKKYKEEKSQKAAKTKKEMKLKKHIRGKRKGRRDKMMELQSKMYEGKDKEVRTKTEKDKKSFAEKERKFKKAQLKEKLHKIEFAKNQTTKTNAIRVGAFLQGAQRGEELVVEKMEERRLKKEEIIEGKKDGNEEAKKKCERRAKRKKMVNEKEAKLLLAHVSGTYKKPKPVVLFGNKKGPGMWSRNMKRWKKALAGQSAPSQLAGTEMKPTKNDEAIMLNPGTVDSNLAHSIPYSTQQLDNALTYADTLEH